MSNEKSLITGEFDAENQRVKPDWSSESPHYKNPYAFQSKSDEVCYIPETVFVANMPDKDGYYPLSEISEGCFTYQDIFDECLWNEERAELAFNMLDGQQYRIPFPEVQNENSILDPKGHVVLHDFGKDALVFTSPQSPEPYVVAHDYDKETGEWSHGSYYSDLADAWDAANPEILEYATVKWTRTDLENALEEQGVEPTKENVSELASRMLNMNTWKDNAISYGNEMLSDEARDISEEIKEEDKHSPTSLGGRAESAKEVSQEFSNSDIDSRTINEER